MIKLRILNAFISRHGRYFKVSDCFHIDGYELVGDESYSFDKDHTYLLFQEIDIPTEIFHIPSTPCQNCGMYRDDDNCCLGCKRPIIDYINTSIIGPRRYKMGDTVLYKHMYWKIVGLGDTGLNYTYDLVGCLNGREIKDHAFEWRLDKEIKND